MIILNKTTFLIFITPKRCEADPKANEITALKTSCQSFAQLYISCQMRDCNKEELFNQKNNLYLPSDSKNADLKPTKIVRFFDVLRGIGPCYIQTIGS